MMPVASGNSVPFHIPARYMLTSILCLVGWAILLPWMLPKLVAAPLSYPVIAWVHLLTIGCIGSMILGASIQLVPVALQTPFPAASLAEWSWVVWMLGIILFEIGFSREILPLLGPGATLLGIVLVGYAVAVTAMFKAAPHRDAVAWHILAAAWLAIIGFVLGWLLALTNVNGLLGDKLLPILAAHIVCMIAGWIGMTLLGVGYKLIGMFTLAERQMDQQRALASGFFVTAGTLLVVIAIVVSWPLAWVTAGAIVIAWGVIVAIIEVERMYRKRMRKAIDIHMPFAVASLVGMLVAVVSLLIVSLEPTPLSHPLTITAVWIALVGCFLIAIQGFFHKISTFLIWLHTYAPFAGKQPVPQLDSMYDRRLAYAGLTAWLFGTLTIAAALMDWLPLWWGWSIGIWLGTGLFVINVVRIGRHWFAPIRSQPLGAKR